jgi:hypothetical protein
MDDMEDDGSEQPDSQPPETDDRLDDESDVGTAGPATERLARMLLGAGSGGVLGLVLSGLLGTAFEGGNVPFWLLTMFVLLLGAGMAVLNGRRREAGRPAPPRAIWAAVAAASSLLVTEGVYLLQAGSISSLAARGGAVTLPLPVWPVASIGLWIAAFLAGGGILLALLGWADAARERGKYAAGRWVAHALLASGGTLGLGLACYVMGNGMSFGG